LSTVPARVARVDDRPADGRARRVHVEAERCIADREAFPLLAEDHAVRAEVHGDHAAVDELGVRVDDGRTGTVARDDRQRLVDVDHRQVDDPREELDFADVDGTFLTGITTRVDGAIAVHVAVEAGSDDDLIAGTGVRDGAADRATRRSVHGTAVQVVGAVVGDVELSGRVDGRRSERCQGDGEAAGHGETTQRCSDGAHDSLRSRMRADCAVEAASMPVGVS
jgi:hypothetical protein